MQANVANVVLTDTDTGANQETNIIKGPWAPRTYNMPDVQVASDGIKMVKATHIYETLIVVTEQLFNNIEIAGFRIDDTGEADAFYDVTLVMEAIKSMLCKHHGLYHPLQDVAKKVFELDEQGLQFAKHVNVELGAMEQFDIAMLEEDDPEPDVDY